MESFWVSGSELLISNGFSTGNSEGFTHGLVSWFSQGVASFSAVHFFVLKLSMQQDTRRKGEQGEDI